MDEKMRQYWNKNLQYLSVLLSLWALAGYAFSIFFVDQLNTITFGGFPLGFWFAQQGSNYVFVALIFVYIFLMGRLDKKFDVHE